MGKESIEQQRFRPKDDLRHMRDQGMNERVVDCKIRVWRGRDVLTMACTELRRRRPVRCWCRFVETARHTGMASMKRCSTMVLPWGVTTERGHSEHDLPERTEEAMTLTAA